MYVRTGFLYNYALFNVSFFDAVAASESENISVRLLNCFDHFCEIVGYRSFVWLMYRILKTSTTY